MNTVFFHPPRLLRIFAVSILLLCTKVNAQNPSLIHYKFYPLSFAYPALDIYGYSLDYFPEDSIYTLKILNNAESLDIGVWTETLAQGWNLGFKDKIMVFDSYFNPVSVIQFRHYNYVNVAGVSNRSIYLTGSQEYYPNITFTAISEIQWTHPPENQLRLVFEYDVDENTLIERLSTRDSSWYPSYNGQYKPYNGYVGASGLSGSMNIERNQNLVLIHDSLLIGGLQFFQNHWVNQNPYENTFGNLSYLSIKYSLADQTTSVDQVGAFPETNMFNFKYFSSKNSSSYYRIASFRGTTSEINPGGVLFIPPSDSAYVTYITKENVNSESQFLTPLYSFNNFRTDTILYNIGSEQDFYSLIEENNRIYLSERLFILTTANDTDSLYFRDCFENDTVYNRMIDFVDSDFGINAGRIVPYSKDLVYVLSDEGEPQIKLSIVNKYIGNTSIKAQSQTPKLSKVDSLFAWVSNYWALSDTTIALVKETPGNNTDTTFIDLPAGKGSCIYWLNGDLDLVDFWNIPYTSPALAGVLIGYIGKYSADTLLIQGTVVANTSTTLEPYGDAFIPFSENVSFLAFYSGLNSVSIKEAEFNPGFSVFPNPASGNITIKQDENAGFESYSIYDLSGRKVAEGSLPDSPPTAIAIDKLHAGMYIFTCTGKDKTASTKFVVK